MPPNNEGDGVDDLERRLGALSTVSNTTRVEISVPLDKVGRVIGRQGSTIQSLQEQARDDNCCITFDTPRGRPGILVIEGPTKGAVDSLAMHVKKVARLDDGGGDGFSTVSSAASTASTIVRPRAGSGQRKLKPPDRRLEGSFGILPWAKVGDKFYFLAQVSYSAHLYDIKIDPLRGQWKSDADASRWHVAVRETREESAYVLRFSAEECPPILQENREEKIYPNQPTPVLVQFETVEALSQFCASYDDNRRKIVDEKILGEVEAKGTVECLGLTWVDPERIVQSNIIGVSTRTMSSRIMQDEPKYRVASELSTDMLAAMKRGLEEGTTDIPRCVLRRSVDDNDLVAYSALLDTSAISTVTPSLSDLPQGWSHSTPFSASEEWLWKRRRQQLRLYGQEDGREMRRKLLIQYPEHVVNYELSRNDP